jgi:RNA polymerase sigma-70 factor (ECF subfamily)
MRHQSPFQDETSALAALMQGDERALSYVFDKYHARLFAYSFRFFKSKDLADEVVQETFVRIWNGKERIDGSQSFEQYLFRIAKNLIIDTFRKLTREKAFEVEIFERMQLFSNYTEEEVVYQELKQISQKAIDLLPKQQRLVFILSRESGLSYAEIAGKLNISVNTVKVHMLNSLNFLRQYLRHEGDLYFLVFAIGVMF